VSVCDAGALWQGKIWSSALSAIADSLGPSSPARLPLLPTLVSPDPLSCSPPPTPHSPQSATADSLRPSSPVWLPLPFPTLSRCGGVSYERGTPVGCPFPTLPIPDPLSYSPSPKPHSLKPTDYTLHPTPDTPQMVGGETPPRNVSSQSLGFRPLEERSQPRKKSRLGTSQSESETSLDFR
jgi:hypothetical protein